MVFQEHLRGEIRLTREIRCGLFFLMKANIFIQFKGSEGQSCVSNFGILCWKAKLFLLLVGRERESKRKQQKASSLWMEVQRTEGSWSSYVGNVPRNLLPLLIFQKVQTLTQTSQVGGLRKAMVNLSQPQNSAR